MESGTWDVASDTVSVRAGEDFDHDRVLHLLREHVVDLPDAPLEVRQFPAGASNLTYLLQVGVWEGVLRRPPFGPLPPKAHDMAREAGLLQRIHPVFSLAPNPYFFCADPDVIGAPFYVMERKKGVVIDDVFATGAPPAPDVCQRVSETMVDTLVTIHGIDWKAAGLEAFGHPDGFLSRQVNGWIDRYSRAQTDEIPHVGELAGRLARNIPSSPAPTLIHNDFKLNNVLLDADDLTRMVAVLDWEMATIGDPLFDLAVSLSYWMRPDDPPDVRAVLPTVTTEPGFIERDAFRELYACKTGRDLSTMPFYEVFAYFRLAVVLQQIYARWKRGQTRDERFSCFDRHVRALMRYATRRADETGL